MTVAKNPGIRKLMSKCCPGRSCLTCTISTDCVCPNGKYRGYTKEEKAMLRPWVKD